MTHYCTSYLLFFLQDEDAGSGSGSAAKCMLESTLCDEINDCGT